jgi:hypothetical protein
VAVVGAMAGEVGVEVVVVAEAVTVEGEVEHVAVADALAVDRSNLNCYVAGATAFDAVADHSDVWLHHRTHRPSYTMNTTISHDL